MTSKKLNYASYDSLMAVEFKMLKILNKQLFRVLSEKDKDSVPKHIFVGSSRIKYDHPWSFERFFLGKTKEEALKILNSSDYDVAFKLSPFVLERLSRTFPNFTKKESDEYGYGKERELRVVYTLPVSDLLALDPSYVALFDARDQADSFSATRHVSLQTCLEQGFAGRTVEFLFFKDLDKISYLWKNLNPDFFVTSLWKKSDQFIGQAALKEVFRTFESLLSYKDSRKPLKDTFGPHPAPVAAENVIGNPVLANLVPIAVGEVA